MKKWIFPIVLLLMLAACQSPQQEVHYIAKSKHWKAVYHSNTEEGLHLFYLGDHHNLGPLVITVEGTKEAINVADVQVNQEGYYAFTKKESAKLFKHDAKPTIEIEWQSNRETLEVKNQS
ncbi:membrane lipoprotein lipid attachment site-containing protein [Lysinibacillus sp. NPDC098008]|uniref:membrane lipoprotein lipid attachment site-containing protein n=1 Tax=Lysinibacillus sp. NPDC098008 TaxID=3364146 RepID=UPI0037F29E80